MTDSLLFTWAELNSECGPIETESGCPINSNGNVMNNLKNS